MGLFPQRLLDDLRMQADIVQVVQDYVPLKKAGVNYRGLCPFHAEKTPSFNVNRDRGFFHCFGCGAGGDVIKFLEMREQIAFPDAVRRLAERFGLEIPAVESSAGDREADQDRELLLKAHEAAAAFFRGELAAPAGHGARRWLSDRGIAEATVERLGIGFAPHGRDKLSTHLGGTGFALPFLLRSGLLVQRDDGTVVDRFRGRVMIPICRESGTIVAFGGRAIEADRQPKYLNSPETGVYSKGRTLYGLHLTRPDIRRLGYAVLVEGYFDAAQALQAGIAPVVALCGTALTPSQVRLLRRHTGKVVLSFDPDAAGEGAAARSSDLLVTEGFQVNVATMPTGLDPDAYIRRYGGAAYGERLRESRPYLDYLLDRAASRHDLGRDNGRRDFLAEMLAVAARIPDAAVRDQFADRLAHKARILEDVVRAEIRKAAASRRTSIAPGRRPAAEFRPAERGLLWALARDPGAAQAALSGLDPDDLDGLAAEPILEAARGLGEFPAVGLLEALEERLKEEEMAIVRRAAEAAIPPAPAAACARALKRLRYEREQAAVQREIDRLQQLGALRHQADIDQLWMKKRALLTQIEALSA